LIASVAAAAVAAALLVAAAEDSETPLESPVREEEAACATAEAVADAAVAAE